MPRKEIDIAILLNKNHVVDRPAQNINTNKLTQQFSTRLATRPVLASQPAYPAVPGQTRPATASPHACTMNRGRNLGMQFRVGPCESRDA